MKAITKDIALIRFAYNKLLQTDQNQNQQFSKFSLTNTDCYTVSKFGLSNHDQRGWT